jgi:hypothetical protein
MSAPIANTMSACAICPRIQKRIPSRTTQMRRVAEIMSQFPHFVRTVVVLLLAGGVVLTGVDITNSPSVDTSSSDP